MVIRLRIGLNLIFAHDLVESCLKNWLPLLLAPGLPSPEAGYLFRAENKQSAGPASAWGLQLRSVPRASPVNSTGSISNRNKTSLRFHIDIEILHEGD